MGEMCSILLAKVNEGSTQASSGFPKPQAMVFFIPFNLTFSWRYCGLNVEPSACERYHWSLLSFNFKCNERTALLNGLSAFNLMHLPTWRQNSCFPTWPLIVAQIIWKNNRRIYFLSVPIPSDFRHWQHCDWGCKGSYRTWSSAERHNSAKFILYTPW